jgi:hypothetical protein
MPFIAIDYYPNEKYNRKLSTGINTEHITQFHETMLFHGNQHVQSTKVHLAHGEPIHVPYTFEEFKAILGKTVVVHDFLIGTGDYYVEVKRYPKQENPPTL